MKKNSFIIILITIFNLTGCANYQELNDLALTSALGIDKIDDGYQISAQIINTQNNKNSNIPTSQITVFTSNGKTIQDALRKVILQSPKKLFIEQLDIMVISEELATDGLKNIIDFFFRDSESRGQFNVLIAKDTTAQNILKVITPLKSISSSNIKDRLKLDNKNLAITEMITFEELINMYLNPHLEIAIPSITIEGSPKEGDKNENIEQSDSTTKIILSDTAIFKEDKFVSYLSNEENIAFSISKNNVNNTIITFKCNENNYTSIELIDVKTKKTISKDKLEITYHISGNANINEINCQYDLEKNSNIQEIEKLLNNHIKDIIITTTDKLQKNINSDALGFNDDFYKNSYKLYELVKNNWYDTYFKQVQINVKSNIKITEKGKIAKVTKNE